MNSIILLLALGSLETSAPSLRSFVASERFLPARPIVRPEPLWVYQTQREVDWPKLDPRDPGKPKVNSAGMSGPRSDGKVEAPAIRNSQFKSDVPKYDESATREVGRSATEASPPRIKQGRRNDNADGNETSPRGAGRSKFSRGEPPEERMDWAKSEPDPQFNESIQSASEDEDFAPTRRMKTSVMRQSGGSRESAPSPFEFRPAMVSDDPEESERDAPYKSFAIGVGDREDDLDVKPYRGDEFVASNRGDVRDTKHTVEEDGESTLQGGKKMPGNESSMWGSLILVLLLFASMGGNLYLAWVAREFYERYRSLAQQVRSARNNLT